MYGKKKDNKCFVSTESMKKSFLITGISNSLYGSEDKIYEG